MDHHGGVLTRFDDLVEVTDRAVADRERQRAVVPNRSFRREQETAGKVGRRHVLVGGDGDQRPLQPPRHVFDESRLAGARRAFQHDRQSACIGRLEQRDLGSDRQVIRLGLDTIGFELHVKLHGPFLRLVPRLSKFVIQGGPSETNFGSREHLQIYDSSAVFRFEVPKRACGD